MSADSQDPPPLHQVSPLLSLHAFNFAEHFKIELRREEEEKWWVSVGAFGREGGERASYPSPPVQAHRPRSEKFKLGGLRLRGESWEEALYRYFLRGSGARCPKVGRREVCFPPARWALAYPISLSKILGRCPHSFLFILFRPLPCAKAVGI